MAKQPIDPAQDHAKKLKARLKDWLNDGITLIRDLDKLIDKDMD